jgi:hypothetical protein
LLACWLVPAGRAFAEGARWYVAPEGSDRGPGTEAEPFQSLDRARRAVRDHFGQNGDSVGEVTVFVRAGHYALNKSVFFSDADSAPDGCRVTYRSYPGEKVVFFGGAALPASAFVPLDPADPRAESVIDPEARKNIRYVPLRAHGIREYGERSYHGFRVGGGATPPMELFVDGRAMTPARWPNEGYAPMDSSVPLEERIIDAGDDWTPENRNGRGGTFRVDFDRLDHWAGAEDLWLDGLVANDWSWQSHPVASIDAEKKTITLRSAAPYTIKACPRFFVENLLEEIDMPGEYFIDRTTGYLYLLPPAGFTADSFICVSTLAEPMVVVEGASRLTFDGLVFDTGRSGAVEVKSGEANRFRNLEIRNVTGTAVRLAGRNNGVSRCVIHHVGGSGVVLAGGDPKTLTAGHNAVEDTDISHFARYDKAYTPGVKLEGVGNRISHCEIHDGPHGGITVGGNDHLIEYTELHHLIQDFSDFGAIYMAIGHNPLQRGHLIRRNFIHDLGAPGRKWCVGVYSDWFSQGSTFEENVFYRIGDDPDTFEFIAAVNSSGRYNNFFNNIFVDCAIPYDRGYNMTYGYKKNGKDKKLLADWHAVFADPAVLAGIHGTRYPELHRFFDEEIWFPDTCRFERNLVYNRAVPLNPEYLPQHFIMDRSSKGWSHHEDLANASDNWVTDVDPGFADISAMNFNLKEDARVLDEIPGFNIIPFNKIGIRK